MRKMKLREVAHARSGEKGDTVDIAVIAYREEDYELIEKQVTVDAVRKLYGPITNGEIRRYEAPNIGALNFVLDEALGGGRSRTLAFDESGKALSSLMLTMDVEVPDDYPARSTLVQMDRRRDHHEEDDGAMSTIKLGAATGWSRDRFGPAEDLVKRGELDYLCFDSMSEVTMSEAQVKKLGIPDAPGYDPYLEDRLGSVIKECKERGIKIISNQGWLEPVAAAEQVLKIAEARGADDLKVAAVNGGILTDRIANMGLTFLETGEPISDFGDRIVSAEAYLGAEEIAEALRNCADVVMTTRVGDACLYLGPLAYEYGWSFDDWNSLAKGMIVGHLMECAGQVTGGYFADPGYKDVPDLANLGHPIAEVGENGTYITKLPSTGGVVSSDTCKEQLLYEVQDPSNYLCPDVVADFTKVRFTDAGKDRVQVEVRGGAGRPEPESLKVLVGIQEGYLAEEMVLFAGPGAVERADLARSVLLGRFGQTKLKTKGIRMDLLGMNSIHRDASPPGEPPYEAVLRVALRTDSIKEAEELRREVDPMAVNGPSGTGKWAPMGNRVRPIVGLRTALVPREEVPVSVVYREM